MPQMQNNGWPEIVLLYEDNHILAVRKPVGIPVQADKSGTPDLLTMLKQDLKIRYRKPGNVYLGLVHRLDQPVGGVMVFAKTSKAAARLQQQMVDRKISKIYLAVVQGTPDWSGLREDWLLKDHKKNIVTAHRKPVPGAKPAGLIMNLMEQGKGHALVEISLITGRPHQIRVQMAASGFPVWGDYKYNPRPSGDAPALWAARLEFIHPVSGAPLEVVSAPPIQGVWADYQIRLEHYFSR